MQMSAEINEIAAALAAAQAIIKNPDKTKVNPHFKSKYADLATGLDCIRPALSANGIAIVQATEIGRDGMLTLVTRLVHSSGQYFGCTYPVAGGMDHQKLGAALTYAKRQALFTIVGVCGDDDDDGNVASANGGAGGGKEPELDESVQRYFVMALETIAGFETADALTAWWSEQKEQRIALDIINTKAGPKPGYRELFAAFSKRGKELSA
jgi:hypothetical protein